jgi:hypothetical protein
LEGNVLGFARRPVFTIFPRVSGSSLVIGTSIVIDASVFESMPSSLGQERTNNVGSRNRSLVVMNVSDTFKKEIETFALRGKKLQSNGWEERKYEVSDN